MYVELKNINKSFKDFKASNNVNFSIVTHFIPPNNTKKKNKNK